MPQTRAPPSKSTKQPSKVSNKPSSKKPSAPKSSPSSQYHPSNGSTTLSHSLPASLQQLILTHFVNTLSLPSSGPGLHSLQTTIQAVKAALYARDFTLAFGSPTFLHAYVARWSVSRSLGYASLFLDLKREIGILPRREKAGLTSEVGSEITAGLDDAESQIKPRRREHVTNVVCLGGGAGAELVGLAAAWSRMVSPGEELHIRLIDSAAWGETLNTLYTGLESLLPEGCKLYMDFQQIDLLAADALDRLRPILDTADAVTLFFTLNELYATSLGRTTRFLLELGRLVGKGVRFCVVDSAGSYAGVTLEQAEVEHEVKGKRYPMAWMLNHTLLELAGKDEMGASWEKILADESRWFRRDKVLEYPLQLEDMRYQVHIYEKI